MSEAGARFRVTTGLAILWAGTAVFVAGLALIAAALIRGWYVLEEASGLLRASASAPALSGVALTGAGFAAIVGSFFRKDLWRPGKQVPARALLLSPGIAGLLLASLVFLGGAATLARYRLEVGREGLRHVGGPVGAPHEVAWRDVARARLVEERRGFPRRGVSRRLEVEVRGAARPLRIGLDDYSKEQVERILGALLEAGVQVTIERGG